MHIIATDRDDNQVSTFLPQKSCINTTCRTIREVADGTIRNWQGRARNWHWASSCQVVASTSFGYVLRSCFLFSPRAACGGPPRRRLTRLRNSGLPRNSSSYARASSAFELAVGPASNLSRTASDAVQQSQRYCRGDDDSDNNNENSARIFYPLWSVVKRDVLFVESMSEYDAYLARTPSNFHTAEFSLNVGPIVRTIPPYELQYREKDIKYVAHYKLGDVIGEGIQAQCFRYSILIIIQFSI